MPAFSAGYMGTLPDIEAEFSYLKKVHSEKSTPVYSLEELDKRSEKDLKPIPRNDKNTLAIIIPQKIKNRLCHLSAINPKKGCESDDVKFETEINIVAIVIEIPIFAAINGIMGLTNPEYASVTKCPALSVFIILFFCCSLISV